MPTLHRNSAKILALAVLFSAVMMGTAHASSITFTGFYEGPFSVIDGTDPARVIFGSPAQASSNAIPVLSFQLNAVWSADTTVTPITIFNGSSVFVGPAGILDTSFSGISTADPTDPNIVNFDVTVLFTGGTINGLDVVGGSGKALGQLNFATAHSSGSINGAIDVVPEPSTLSVAALGLSSLAFVAWRRRRGRGLHIAARSTNSNHLLEPRRGQATGRGAAVDGV